jgi:hypothetical protein
MDDNIRRQLPPSFKSAYIRSLEALAEKDRAEHAARRAEQDRAKLKEASARLTPLQDRVEKLLSTIPMELQRKGLALATLQKMLKGRWRGNCHPGELGAVLRKLGFVRKRRWDDKHGFCARWYLTK